MTYKEAKAHLLNGTGGWEAQLKGIEALEKIEVIESLVGMIPSEVVLNDIRKVVKG